jgi:hypothetical protein
VILGCFFIDAKRMMHYAHCIYCAVYASSEGNMALMAVGKASAGMIINPDEYDSAAQFITERLPLNARSFVRQVPETYGYLVEQIDANTCHVANNTPARDTHERPKNMASLALAIVNGDPSTTCADVSKRRQ